MSEKEFLDSLLKNDSTVAIWTHRPKKGILDDAELHVAIIHKDGASILRLPIPAPTTPKVAHWFISLAELPKYLDRLKSEGFTQTPAPDRSGATLGL